MNLKRILGPVIRKTLTVISPELNARIVHLIKTGNKLNLTNPETFTEKLLFLKLADYNSNPLVKQCADKYAVRQYVTECGFGEILNPLIAVYDSPDEIKWEIMPDQFALKMNCGCGHNIICRDLKALDIEKCKKLLRKWDKERQYLEYAELQYKDVERKILIESFLTTKENHFPEDYKCYCFNGICEAILYISERDTDNPKAAFFSTTWEYLGVPHIGDKPSHYKELIQKPPAPRSLKQMVDTAEALARPFPFVRVDFYDVDGRLVFGEMTFTPSGGHDASETQIRGMKMGQLLELN